MNWKTLFCSLFLSVAVTPHGVLGDSATQKTNPFEVISLSAPDGSVHANFIPLGATVTNFWVKDKSGHFRDIMLGFDNLTLYQDIRQFFSPIVGRYANRIRNGTFTIPISKDASGPNKFHVPLNENNVSSLHGGTNGYDRRVWTVAKKSSNSVTFTLLDPDGEQGFPGAVHTTATYTLERKATWKTTFHSTATKKTPIMLSSHAYWNLEAYKETQDLVGHHAQFGSSKIIATDGILIPTGKLLPVEGTALDFRKAKSIGGSINATAAAQYCGTGCVGFDNCWIYDHNNKRTPAVTVWSVNSGIKLDVITDQPALQIYSCNGIASAAIPRKRAHGGPSALYENHSCVVLEQESWIDAINNPEFGIDQIYSPARPYNWEATYIFSTL